VRIDGTSLAFICRTSRVRWRISLANSPAGRGSLLEMKMTLSRLLRKAARPSKREKRPRSKSDPPRKARDKQNSRDKKNSRDITSHVPFIRRIFPSSLHSLSPFFYRGVRGYRTVARGVCLVCPSTRITRHAREFPCAESLVGILGERFCNSTASPPLHGPPREERRGEPLADRLSFGRAVEKARQSLWDFIRDYQCDEDRVRRNGSAAASGGTRRSG